MTRALPLLALLLATTACARSAQQAVPTAVPAAVAPAAAATAAPSAPAPAAALNPVGTYEFSTSAQGTDVSGTIVISSVEGRYAGSVVTSATPEAPIKSVSVAGQVITVVIPTPDGSEGVLEMRMDGVAFTGSWSYGGMNGTLSGRRRTP